ARTRPAALDKTQPAASGPLNPPPQFALARPGRAFKPGPLRVLCGMTVLTVHGAKRTLARVFGFSTSSETASAGRCWIATARWWFTRTGRPSSYTQTDA